MALTDLDLTKAISKIEGEHFNYISTAHTFELMVKHKIEFKPDCGNKYGAYDMDHRVIYRSTDPQRAILLAIVAKFEAVK